VGLILYLAAVVLAILAAILLLIDAIDLKDGLALLCISVAALALAPVQWPSRLSA
jgi:hypothetical protein